MKKSILFIAVILMTMFVQAKKHTIVINGHSTIPKGSTEVKIEQNFDSDSIFITPGVNVADIEVNVVSTLGAPVAQYWISADDPFPLDVATPEIPEGSIIEVRDNTGVIYSDVE